MSVMEDHGVFTISQLMVSQGYKFERQGRHRTLKFKGAAFVDFEDDPVGSAESHVRLQYREYTKVNGAVLGGGRIPGDAEEVARLVTALDMYKDQVAWLPQQLEEYQNTNENKVWERARLLSGIMLKIRKERTVVTTSGEKRTTLDFEQFQLHPHSVVVPVPGIQGATLVAQLIEIAKLAGKTGVCQQLPEGRGFELLIDEHTPLIEALGYNEVNIDFSQGAVQAPRAPASAGKTLKDLLISLKNTSPQGGVAQIARHMGFSSVDVELAAKIQKLKTHAIIAKAGGLEPPDLIAPLNERHPGYEPTVLRQTAAVVMYMQRNLYDDSLKDVDKPGYTLNVNKKMISDL